jgi:hypothetical protein
MKTKTELDHKFEYKNNPEFAKEVLISMLVSFLSGCILGSIIILTVMNFIDWL